MKLWILGSLLFGQAGIASADNFFPAGPIILFTRADCTSPVAAIPMGSSHVDCSSLPGLNTWINGMRVAGDSTCIPVSGNNLGTDICKAYNVK